MIGKLIVFLFLLGSAVAAESNVTTVAPDTTTVTENTKSTNVTTTDKPASSTEVASRTEVASSTEVPSSTKVASSTEVASSIKVAPSTKTTSANIASINISDIQFYKPFESVDPNTLSCDPAGQIFLLLPHFYDCTKFFMCAHGEEVLFECAGNGLLYFDFELQGCNWASETNCILRTLPEEDDVDGSGEGAFDWLSDNADKPSDGSVLSLTGDAVANAVKPISLEVPARSSGYNIILNCMRPDSASRQLTYKGDCQRYWRCVNGVPQAMYCTDGLYFNEKKQQCDFEANANCLVEQEDELKSEFIAVK